MRVLVRLFGRDLIEVTTDPETDDPTADIQGFGFAAGTTLYLERAEHDDDPPEEP